MLARSKLNGIESKISEALIDNEIRMKTFWLLLNDYYYYDYDYYDYYY